MELQRSGFRGRAFVGLAIAVSALVASVASATERNFAELSLTELMNEPVTTVSKKATRLGDAPTAITVITADDIRRNGITSIPEALRLVPGFDVARIDSSHWAISARGFNLQYANTLLVLMDGRSVYTPAFGGVYWDAQDMVLEDLDRIEVIRGPGATLWGANAVNGVVNIISKSSRETQGALLSAYAGTEEQPLLETRYGGAVGESAHYRVYAKYFNRDGLDNEDGSDAFDNWHSIRLGFRTDWERSAEELVTVQGDYYSLRSEHLQNEIVWTPPYQQTVREEREAEGANLVARWTRTLTDASHVSVQAYLDSYTVALESRHTADVQLEHRLSPWAGHDVVWGVGYRASRDDLTLGADVTTIPGRRTMSLYTAFIQDEISLVPDRLSFTLGTKLEHNDFTGLEVQPNLRLLFAPNSRSAVWAAASRAVSTPSRFYHDTRYNVAAFQPPGGPIIVAALLPNQGLPSSKVDAYELGYRVEPASTLSFDIAAFINRYRDIPGQMQGDLVFEADPVPHLLLPQQWQPNQRARARGVEATAKWRPLDAWQLTASYSWLHLRVEPVNTLGVGSPSHQANLRSHVSLSRNLELHSALYYVGSIDSLNSTFTTTRIPDYTRLDTGLLYRPSATLELGVWGQNLLDRRHGETTGPDSAGIREIPRSVLARVTTRF